MNNEKISINNNGQWKLNKKEKRCWKGYEPTPGKKPYEEDSCQPISKSEIEVSIYDNGDVELTLGEDIDKELENEIVSSILQKCEYLDKLEKKDRSPKKEHKSGKGGLTAKGRESYNRATGGHLKAPQPGGGPRKRSFCARNAGQIKMHNIDCKSNPDKRACKARRRWKC